MPVHLSELTSDVIFSKKCSPSTHTSAVTEAHSPYVSFVALITMNYLYKWLNVSYGAQWPANSFACWWVGAQAQEGLDQSVLAPRRLPAARGALVQCPLNVCRTTEE